jgi:hypothetical protein
MLISNSSMPTLTNASKKSHKTFDYYRFCAFFRGFLLLLTFVRTFLEFEISIKFCVFLITILFFWVIIALFAILKCKCEKTVHFQTFSKK